MSLGNHYDGIIDQWQLELIHLRAQRLGVRRHDLEDVQQEIVVELLDFEFDETKSNGASERTVLTSVIDHCLLKFLRTKQRQRHCMKEMDGDCELQETWDTPNGVQSLSLDLKTVLVTLPDEQQRVCTLLATGHSITQIAKHLGRSWHGTNKIVLRIRKHFAELGMDDLTHD